MNGKLAAILAGLALVVALVVWFATGEGPRRTHQAGPLVAAEPGREVAEKPLAAVETPSAPAAEAAREELHGAPEAAAANPWRGELAGVIGRVVESDGTPVPGLRVALLEFDSTILFDDSALGEGPRSLVLEDALTDREGRFVLGGARGPAFHGLGIDLNGPRATVRIVDQALPHGERTDLGDIVLAPYGILAGRVVDEAGTPVPGVRVRASPGPEEILLGEPYEFREQSLVAVSMLVTAGDGQGIIEPPPWVREAIERFPLPTTKTGQDGTFRLEGVALAKVIGGADKAGWVGAPIGPIDLREGGEKDVGDLVLKRGRTIEGFVEDPFGEPLAGVAVFAGAEIAPGTAAILQPCGTTDEDGRFTLTGVRESGQVVAAARRSPHEPWSVTSTGRTENVLIELKGQVGLTVHVADEAGAPLSGTRLMLKPKRKDSGGMGFGMALSFLPRPVSPPGTFRETEPGTYVCGALTVGDYVLDVRAAGRAPQQRDVQCVLETNEITVTCPPGRVLEVTVLDALTSAPVRDARVSAMRLSMSGLARLAAERTGADGKARLGPLPGAGEPAGRGPFPNSTTLLVRHPRYGDHTTAIPDGAPNLTVELGAGGTLAGRVHWGGAVPTRLYMVALESRGREEAEELFYLPRLGVTGLDGTFRIPMLPAGRYRMELIERFLDQDPMGLAAQEFDPVSLHREEVEIRDGETTEVEIDLTPTGRGPTARLRGQVRVDGQPIAAASVRVRSGESVTVETDLRGRFETPEFVIRDQVSLTIEGDPSGAADEDVERQLYYEELELENGDVRDVDVDLYRIEVPVRVVDDASGDGLSGATLSLRLEQGNVRYNQDSFSVDENGRTTLAVLQPGPYRITGKARDHSEASTTVEIPPEGVRDPVELRLPASVPCLGHVRVLDATVSGEQGFSYLWVQREGGNSSAARLQPPEYAFALDNMSAGTYKAWIYVGSQQGVQQEFELGPEGNTNLVLDFVPQQN